MGRMAKAAWFKEMLAVLEEKWIKYMNRSIVWSLLTNSRSCHGLHINIDMSIQAPYMASLYLLEYTEFWLMLRS